MPPPLALLPLMGAGAVQLSQPLMTHSGLGVFGTLWNYLATEAFVDVFHGVWFFYLVALCGF